MPEFDIQMCRTFQGFHSGRSTPFASLKQAEEVKTRFTESIYGISWPEVDLMVQTQKNGAIVLSFCAPEYVDLNSFVRCLNSIMSNYPDP